MTFQLTFAIAAVNTSGMQALLVYNMQHRRQMLHTSWGLAYTMLQQACACTGASHRYSCIPRLPGQKHPHGFPDGLLHRGHDEVDELCDPGQAGVAARVRMGTEPHSKARVLDVVAGYEAKQLQWQPEVRLQAAQNLPVLTVRNIIYLSSQSKRYFTFPHNAETYSVTCH